MQAKITWTLTESAQLAQMAATGQPVARKQTHVIEVSPADLELLRADEAGNLSAEIDHTRINYIIDAVPRVQVGATPEEAWAAYKAAYVARKAKIEAARADEERGIARRLAETEAADAAAAAWIDARSDEYDPWNVLPQAISAAGIRTPDMDAKLPLARAAYERLKARSAAHLERKKAAAAEREAAKEAYINEWIEKNADADTQQQHRDGLLDRKAALALIAGEAFAAAGVGDAYEPVICDDASCPCRREDIDTLPREAYAAWRQMKAALPENVSAAFEVVHQCMRDEYSNEGREAPRWLSQGEEAAAPQYAALIKLPVGPFTFKRLVRL